MHRSGKGRESVKKFLPLGDSAQGGVVAQDVAPDDVQSQGKGAIVGTAGDLASVCPTTLRRAFGRAGAAYLRTAGTSIGRPSPRQVRYSASCRIRRSPQGGGSARMPA